MAMDMGFGMQQSGPMNDGKMLEPSVMSSQGPHVLASDLKTGAYTGRAITIVGTAFDLDQAASTAVVSLLDGHKMCLRLPAKADIAKQMMYTGTLEATEVPELGRKHACSGGTLIVTEQPIFLSNDDKPVIALPTYSRVIEAMRKYPDFFNKQ
eukprot:Hpha_TRINITY_DN13100_c0_g1::TRINITY_DN13100_c0_g1_i1::g.113608::m.113608